jgi:hypothetical protein
MKYKQVYRAKKCGSTYKVVHKGSTLEKNGGVVGECSLVDIRAVLSDVSAIVHQPAVMIDVVDRPEPVPSLLGVFSIRFVSSVSRKASAEIEETSVGDGCKKLASQTQNTHNYW